MKNLLGATTRLLLGFGLAGATLAAALPVPTVLPPGEPLLAPDALGVFTLQTHPPAQANARAQVVAVGGPGFAQAWKVETLQDTSPSDAIQLRALNAKAVKAGDVGLLRFFARATDITDETGGARVMIVIRSNGVDWNSSYEGDFSFRTEWEEILIPFVFGRDFAPGEAAVRLQFGFKRQGVELGGVDLVNYGRSRTYSSLPRTSMTYAGREPGAKWREEALARIGQIRKSGFQIVVADASGKPVPGAKVHLAQVRSAFEWGSALQMERLVVDSPDNLRYREVTQELFNSASTENDLKWPVWLGEWEGNFAPQQTLAGLHWLHDRGFHLRGHVLVWPGRKNLPDGVQALLDTPRNKEIPAMVEAHIRDITRANRGLLEEWDVLNEPFTNHDLMDQLGPQVMVPWFKVAREELPSARLVLNDFSNHDATTDGDHVAHFEKTARYLLDHGAPLTGLGLQAHFGGRPSAPVNILAVLDRYEREFHLPMRVTEFDVWTYDDELQADFTRDFLILCYSHPSIVGVQHWGFWESCHWRPPAAMYRADWSEKPNAKVYKDLVLHQWRTQLEGTADRQGSFAARGFQGEYRVTIEADGRRVEKNCSLPASSRTTIWRITLP